MQSAIVITIEICSLRISILPACVSKSEGLSFCFCRVVMSQFDIIHTEKKTIMIIRFDDFTDFFDNLVICLMSYRILFFGSYEWKTHVIIISI